MYSKEEILKKIKEWSKENDGKTPGEKVFYEYADFNVYQLHKLGWANYGELVDEAELIPNTFDNTQYSYEQICDLFISAMREKNQWPSRGYLDVKHLNDSSYPSSATFYKKLGLTGDLAQSILDYIGDKDDYDDVKNICLPVIEKYAVSDKSDEAGKTVEEVYMYKYKNQSQPIKVGRSKDVERRGEEIVIGAHDKAVLIHSIKTDDPSGVENYWHRRFRKSGREEYNNEWFRLKPEDVKAFKRWKKIY